MFRIRRKLLMNKQRELFYQPIHHDYYPFKFLLDDQLLSKYEKVRLFQEIKITLQLEILCRNVIDTDRFLQNYFGSILPPTNLENREKVIADLVKTYSQARQVDGQKLLI